VIERVILAATVITAHQQAAFPVRNGEDDVAGRDPCDPLQGTLVHADGQVLKNLERGDYVEGMIRKGKFVGSSVHDLSFADSRASSRL